MDLDSLKYVELQQLAKSIGLKANMKADKLLKAVKQHYSQSQTENAGEGISQDEEDSCADQQLPNHDGTFVTARRARGQKAKRKQREAEESEPEIDGGVPQSPSQADEESGDATEGQGSPKRRKVSAEEDCGTALMEEGSKVTALPSCTTDGVAEGPVGGEDLNRAKPAGKIPRHEGLLKKAKRSVLKPTTPNFRKLHEAHFNKMESIDSYLQRKNKQMETIRNPVKELKILSEKANIIKPVEKKAAPKPKVSREILFSPVTEGRRSVAEKRRLTQPAPKTGGSFKPTVLATRRMNVSFSQTTRYNENKSTLVKTPARMSPLVDLPSTPTEQVKRLVKKPAVSSTKMLAPSVTKTPGVIPFVFNGNVSISETPGTQKNTFDLKASLSRPLSYQPHKGKLKPFADVKEEGALNSTRLKNYKTHQVQTRVDRRARHTEDRKQKKEKVLGARRGLAMS